MPIDRAIDDQLTCLRFSSGILCLSGSSSSWSLGVLARVGCGVLVVVVGQSRNQIGLVASLRQSLFGQELLQLRDLEGRVLRHRFFCDGRNAQCIDGVVGETDGDDAMFVGVGASKVAKTLDDCLRTRRVGF